jgi:spore coat polysaccharide biosynthesis protein SpsF
MVKKIAVIQARLSSSRLPGKVLKDLCGKTLLERVVERVRESNLLDEIWLATSTEKTDDILEIVSKQLNIKLHRGSLNNVLERFCEVAIKSNADIIVRVTADNPLTEPTFIDQGINEMLNNDVDYINFEDIPYGSGVEIIKKESLLLSNKLTNTDEDIEHVTLFIKKNSHKFKIKTLIPENKFRRPDIRVTIDTLDDYVKMFKVYHLLSNSPSSCKNYLEKAIDLFDRGEV